MLSNNERARTHAPVADQPEGTGEDDVDRRVVDGVETDRAERHDRRKRQPIWHPEQPHPVADQRQMMISIRLPIYIEAIMPQTRSGIS
jgi:hypothetical protein